MRINGLEVSADFAANVCSTALGKAVDVINVERVGSGAHGTAIRAKTRLDGNLILKIMSDETSFGHDFPTDRIASLLHAHASSRRLCPGQSLGVVIVQESSPSRFIATPSEAVAVMHEFPTECTLMTGIRSLGDKLIAADRAWFVRLREAMTHIHSISAPPPVAVHIHRRKLRETVGHSELLLGILDSFGTIDGFGRKQQMEYATAAIAARYALIDDLPLVTQVHGDLHCGNVLIGDSDLHLVDPGRGQFGHPAEDIASAVVDLILWSVFRFNGLEGAYLEAVSILLDDYVAATNRQDTFRYLPFYLGAKCPVVVHPGLYPDIPGRLRIPFLKIGSAVLAETNLDTKALQRLVSQCLEAT